VARESSRLYPVLPTPGRIVPVTQNNTNTAISFNPFVSAPALQNPIVPVTQNNTNNAILFNPFDPAFALPDCIAPARQNTNAPKNKAIPRSPVVPAPASPARIAPVRQNTVAPEDGVIRIVSYVDLAYEHLFNGQQNDQAIWNSLPPIVQRDVLRHSYHNRKFQGKAEQLARNLFEYNSIKLKKEFEQLDKPNHQKQRYVQGEKLLEFYYSEEGIRNPLQFQLLFKEFQLTKRFLAHVYEMAYAAGIDRKYAKENWNDRVMIPLSIQALEKYLHTS
jgi:hypothetical protein